MLCRILLLRIGEGDGICMPVTEPQGAFCCARRALESLCSVVSVIWVA